MEITTDKLKLGLIGISEGNGHPYSWSAIINGFNRNEMAKCPFPLIPRYLSVRNYPEDFITGAEVTHIWTQNSYTSKAIAKASNIKYIVQKPEEMVNYIDALLLARDDAENHLTYARPFIEAGIPIYIDKPLAIKIANAHKILSIQKFDSQIFTCSALRYAKELKCSEPELEKLGSITQIVASSPKNWNKYGIHIIEPVLSNYISNSNLEKVNHKSHAKYNEVEFITSSNIKVCFITTGESHGSISIELIGINGSQKKIFSDSFNAFKKALETFLRQIKIGKNLIPRKETETIISIIEQGV